MMPSRTRLFRLHALLLALPSAAQLTLAAVVSALSDLASYGTSYADLGVELASIVARERALADRYPTTLLLQSLCTEFIVNHTTICISAATPAELHAQVPTTRHIDLSSGAQVASKVGALMIGSGLKLRWQQRHCCLIGTLFVVYAEAGAAAPLIVLQLCDAGTSVQRRKDPSQFTVHTKSQKLLLRSVKENDIQDVSLWIDAIRTVIQSK